MRTPPPLVAALAAVPFVLAAACGDRITPTGPDGDATPATIDGVAAAAAPIDIAGAWDWHETGHIVLTEEAAALFGVAPEGPITDITCESGGILTIVQTGDAFTGTATQSSLCETKGGQQFVPLPFPPSLDVIDGRINGRNVEFLFGAGPVPCPYTASARVDAGTVTALVGTGRCIVPGHPQSPLPVPPPPLAPTKTIEWVATR